MRFTFLTTTFLAIAISSVSAAVAFPPKNDPRLKLWDGPADVYFPADVSRETVEKAAWAAWSWGKLVNHHNLDDNGRFLTRDGRLLIVERACTNKIPLGHDKGFQAILSTAAVAAMSIATGPNVPIGIVWKGGLQGDYCPEVVKTCPERA